jgi:MoaA/NifB/PqqE/SkfB family radical SAM enzyme
VHHEKPLTFDEYKKILRELRTWLGPVQISFGGGEPFLNKNLVKLIDYAYELGLRVDMTTNASLIGSEAAKKLSSLNKFYFAISLDGVNPETHDYLRGVPETYRKAMNAIEFMNKDYVAEHIVISTTIMNYNIDEIVPLVNYLKKKGIASIAFQALAPTFGEPYYDGWYLDNPLFPRTKKQKEKVLKVIDTLMKMKKKDDSILNSYRQFKIMKGYFTNPAKPVYKRCHLGTDNFVIDGYGKVRFCFVMPEVSNIRKKSPEEIWYSKEAIEARKKIRHCERKCSMVFCTYTPSFSENLGKWIHLDLRKGIINLMIDAKKFYNQSVEFFPAYTSKIYSSWKNRNLPTQEKETVRKKEVRKPEFIEKLNERHTLDIARFEKFLAKKHPDLVERYNLFCKLMGAYFGKRALIATHYRRLGGCVY